MKRKFGCLAPAGRLRLRRNPFGQQTCINETAFRRSISCPTSSCRSTNRSNFCSRTECWKKPTKDVPFDANAVFIKMKDTSVNVFPLHETEDLRNVLQRDKKNHIIENFKLLELNKVTAGVT
jgi:hypothetical protein